MTTSHNRTFDLKPLLHQVESGLETVLHNFVDSYRDYETRLTKIREIVQPSFTVDLTHDDTNADNSVQEEISRLRAENAWWRKQWKRLGLEPPALEQNVFVRITPKKQKRLRRKRARADTAEPDTVVVVKTEEEDEDVSLVTDQAQAYTEQEEEEQEEEEQQEEQEEEEQEKEEEEVFEVVLSGTTYYTNDLTHGTLYAVDPNGDPGDEVGRFVQGKAQFTSKKI